MVVRKEDKNHVPGMFDWKTVLSVVVNISDPDELEKMALPPHTVQRVIAALGTQDLTSCLLCYYPLFVSYRDLFDHSSYKQHFVIVRMFGLVMIMF